MEPYALFLDIDRTLTSDNHIIPKRNIDALAEARRQGHKVFINTGRSYGNIPRQIFEQIEVDGVVSGNGTAICLDGEFIYTSFMPQTTIEKIAHYCCDNPQYWVVFEGLKRSYCLTDRGRTPAPYDVIVAGYDDFFSKFIEDEVQVIAVSRNFDEKFLESLSDEIIYYRFDHYFDITTKGNNKSYGMFRVLDALGIPRERSIAFGDSENDKNMLMDAGIGVAVSNSQPDLFKIADYISLSNAEGGVGAAVEKFLLKGENI